MDTLVQGLSEMKDLSALLNDYINLSLDAIDATNIDRVFEIFRGVHVERLVEVNNATTRQDMTSNLLLVPTYISKDEEDYFV